MPVLKNGLLCLTLIAAAMLESCASTAHDPNENYVLVAANTRIPYWQAALEGLRRAGSEMKVKVDMVGPQRYDPKAEKEALANAIAEKPSGILISAADPNLLSDEIDSALQQGIPVITIDADAPASKRLFFVGSDNYNAGRLGGRLLVKTLNGKGNVVMFTYPRQDNLLERQKGYESVFQDYPNIQVTKAVDIQGDPAVAYTTAKELVTSKAKVDAFVCLEAIACPEVGEVVKENNMAGKVTIMAMDTDKRTIQWIDQNLVFATIAQRPFTMAYVGLKLLDELHHSKPASLQGDFAHDPYSPYPSFVDTGTFIVDKNNKDQFLKQSESQGAGR
jgi:ribose transport system substrate-binding protein